MRHPHDFYATPEAVVAAVAPYLPAHLGTVLDPAAGDGVFQRVLATRADKWLNLDIRKDARAPGLIVTDFLEQKTYPYQFDTIITNPPFSRLTRYIEVGLSLKPKRMIYFTRLSALEGKDRYARLWKWAPPRNVVVLPTRPSFTGNNKTDQWAYCWLLWGDVPWSGVSWTPVESLSTANSAAVA